MKFIIATLLAYTSGAFTAAVPLEQSADIAQSANFDYVQNYNGNAAQFKYNQAQGTYSVKWAGGTNFVTGLGWSRGGPRTIKYSGTYSPVNSGSFFGAYGWLENPLTEYYVVESFGTYDPCADKTAKQHVTFKSADGLSSYKVCSNIRTNQPSIHGTATFKQFFSVRQGMRTSGTINTGEHFSHWAKHGFANKNFGTMSFITEAWSGSGSASVTLS
ncbi:putative endo-1,4-beta-xylanase 5 [Cercospora beticola]|uniref:Endo-1,4-beta-xylanase n=1 Tax=Cercospora beticola TaxID=122368 RepID=A0A2G5HLU7_CERBT|nr:putative endo-1,4-beta-xylanase 5 [Cercospora beticola]PIA93213.1 putative endo-1,4-beta-xylanase 5 [Cercospora beticola]WPB02561.1 hypothetical protein RHO25_007197 [Cercospora beticola]